MSDGGFRLHGRAEVERSFSFCWGIAGKGIPILRHQAMFKIRKEQLDALSKASLKSFEERMVIHLLKFFQPQCEPLGDARVRETIHYGIARAKSYGIIAERDVCKYIDLMFAFGADFDKDPNYSLAPQILMDKNTPDPTQRINKLFETALEHVRQAASARAQNET